MSFFGTNHDPTQFQERPYQIEARDAAFRQWQGGIASTLLVMPTGTGKTVVGGMIAKQAKDQFNRRTLFLAHREILVSQAAEKIQKFGLSVAVEMAADDAFKRQGSHGRADVVVGTVQSLQGDRLTRWPKDEFGLVIVDECHHARAQTYQNILEWFGGWRLGITATPDGSAKGNLGSVFENYCYRYPLADAIEQGSLCPITRMTAMVNVDLRKIRTTGGDFNLGDLSERINPHVEEIASATLQLIDGRSTVVFTPDVGSASAVAQMIEAKGGTARYVAGSGGRFGMSKDQRRETLQQFHDGRFQVVVCCDLLIEGWDQPQVSCVVIARPTRKRYRYVQMLGRGTRPNKGGIYEDCLLVDLDWQTDSSSKKLCRETALFDDGTLDPKAVSYANRLIRERGEKDILKAIREGERYARTAPKLHMAPTGKKATFQVVTDNPAGVAKLLDLKWKPRYDMDKSGRNPATEKQIEALARRGISAVGVSKWGASKLIREIKKREERGWINTSKVDELIKSGVEPGFARVMNSSQADYFLSLAKQAQMF